MMIGGFEEREKGIEAKWAHDEDLRFRTLTRRNKLLAQWAAETMGLQGDAAGGYVAALLEMEVRGVQDEDLIRKLHDDFAARNVAFSEHYVRRKMQELALDAANQIMNETKA